MNFNFRRKENELKDQEKGYQQDEQEEEQEGELANELYNIDLEQIENNNDIARLEQCLPILLTHDPNDEEFTQLDKQSLVKYLRLGQMTMEYLGFTNKYLDNVQLNLNTKHEQAQAEEKELDEQENNLKIKYGKLKKKVEMKKEKVRQLRKQDNKPNYKCQFCQDKVFIDESSLDNHLRKRHPQQTAGGVQVQQQPQMAPLVMMQPQPQQQEDTQLAQKVQHMLGQAILEQNNKIDQHSNNIHKVIDQYKQQDKQQQELELNQKQDKEQQLHCQINNLQNMFGQLTEKMDETEKKNKEVQQKQSIIDKKEGEKQLIIAQKQREYDEMQQQIIELTEQLRRKQHIYYSGVLESDNDSVEKIDREVEVIIEKKIPKEKQTILLDDTDLYEKERDLLEVKNTKGSMLISESQKQKVEDNLPIQIANAFYKLEGFKLDTVHQMNPDQCEFILQSLRAKLSIDIKQVMNGNDESAQKKIQQREAAIKHQKNLQIFWASQVHSNHKAKNKKQKHNINQSMQANNNNNQHNNNNNSVHFNLNQSNINTSQLEKKKDNHNKSLFLNNI